MMIKITSRCTMGCTHCMSDCKPDGRDMSQETLIKTLDFLRKNHFGGLLLISGGEPLEHENFPGVIDTICGWNDVNHFIVGMIILTNGEKIQNDGDTYTKIIRDCKSHNIHVDYQVSADPRFYPRRIQTFKHIFKEPGFLMVDNCVEQVYPQGRAIDNNIPWQSKAPKCFNVRALAKQLQGCKLSDIEAYLVTKAMKFCTPHISINGEIKLGESDLCPVCASIDDEMNIIMRKIRRFNCSGCSMILEKLPKEYRDLIQRGDTNGQ